MIKKLIEKYETHKDFSLIKKHFKVAKKHNSVKELEDVKNELMDFEGKLTKEHKCNDNILFNICSLYSEVDYAKLTFTSSDLEC